MGTAQWMQFVQAACNKSIADEEIMRMFLNLENFDVEEMAKCLDVLRWHRPQVLEMLEAMEERVL